MDVEGSTVGRKGDVVVWQCLAAVNRLGVVFSVGFQGIFIHVAGPYNSTTGLFRPTREATASTKQIKDFQPSIGSPRDIPLHTERRKQRRLFHARTNDNDTFSRHG